MRWDKQYHIYLKPLTYPYLLHKLPATDIAMEMCKVIIFK